LKTYSLHDVLKCVETDIASCGTDLSVHGHGNTLTKGGNDEGPFSANQRKLDRGHGDDGTENTGGVDVNVVQVSLCDGTGCGDFVSEQDQGQELTGKIERPVVAHVGNSQENEDEHL
jgi:hypothetical protein